MEYTSGIQVQLVRVYVRDDDRLGPVGTDLPDLFQIGVKDVIRSVNDDPPARVGPRRCRTNRPGTREPGCHARLRGAGTSA